MIGKQSNQAMRLQWWWYVLLLLVLTSGVVLICANWRVAESIQRLTSAVPPDSWSRLFGIFLVSIVITHLAAFYLSRGLYRLFDLSGTDTLADVWSPAVVGICESVMYPTAFLIGSAEFIGVWLAVKTAGQWVRWGTEGQQDVIRANEGRRRYNRFLVGNAFSVMAAVVTYGAFKIWVLD